MAKKKVKKLIKRKPTGTSINIKIDNSKRTVARRHTQADIKPKGHVNLPITYFSQYQPARTYITDQKPNTDYNISDMLYQKQYKNYFDDKLTSLEKAMLEVSEKKNTAPPRPHQQPGAYDTFTDYDGNKLMENIKPTLKNRASTSITKANPTTDTRSTDITDIDATPLPQSTTIAEGEELSVKKLLVEQPKKEREKLIKEVNKDETFEKSKRKTEELYKKLGLNVYDEYPAAINYENAQNFSNLRVVAAKKYHEHKMLEKGKKQPGIAFKALKEHNDPATKAMNQTNRNVKEMTGLMSHSNMEINRKVGKVKQNSKELTDMTGIKGFKTK